MQTDIIQQLKDPRVIAAAAAVLVIAVIVIAALIMRVSKRRRGLRGAEEANSIAREREAQFEAALNALPYSQDPGEAARGVAQVFGQYQQVRVLAIYAGKQGHNKLANILKGPTGTGSLTRAELAPTIDAKYYASHDRPQFTQRADLTGANAAAAQGSASSATPAAGSVPAARQSSSDPAAGGAAAQPATTQGAITSPLDDATPRREPPTAGPPPGAVPPGEAPHPQGTSVPNAQQARGTSSLGGGGAASGSGGVDSKPVGLLPWHGLFGWRGLVVIESREPVDLEDLAIVFQSHPQLTNRISLALELDCGISAAGSAIDQSSRLVEFLRLAAESVSTQPALTETLKHVAELMASDSAAFWAVDSKTGMLRMMAAFGLNPDGFLPVPRGQGLSGLVAESRQPLAAEDAPADPRCLFPNEARESGIGSYLGVPVFSDGEVEGVLEIHTRQAHEWGPAAISTMRAAAIALSVINRGATGAATAQGGLPSPPPQAPAGPEGVLKTESAYMTMSQTLESLGSRNEVVEAAVEVLGHALGVSRVISIEKGGQTGYLNAAVISHEYHVPDVPSTLGAMMPEDVAGPLFQSEGAQWPLVVNDSSTGSPMPEETITRLHICSELMLPLRMNGDVIAVIDLQECDQPREWTRDEIDFAEKVAHQASHAIGHLAALDKASRELEAARSEARRAADVATRARGMIDSVPEAIIGLDRDGRLTFFNAPGRVRYKLKNEDLGRMVSMVESLTLSDGSIWEKVKSSHGIVRFEATITAPRAAAPLAAPDRRSAQGRNAVSLPISIAVAPVRNDKEEIAGRILVLTDLSHIRSHSKKDAGEHVAELEAKVKATEAALSEANRVIENAAAADAASGRAAYVVGEIEKVRTDEARARRAAQQLLEINRLKSDFIVNAGHELDASLQSVLGFAELLGQGQYGQLTPDQLEAIKGIYAWARRMKNDVDWLIEYGSTRSRTLEAGVEEVSE